jgi:hypothetical protein
MSSSRVLPTGDPSILGFIPERFEPLHRRIQRFVSDGQHASISLLSVRNGEIADTFAVGFRNRELGLPMTRDTIVRVYSLTKIVVSVAALTLLEEGKIGIARSSGGIPSGVSGPSRACWWNISRPAIGSCGQTAHNSASIHPHFRINL